jgi:ribosomal protein L11 methyltransferase
MSFKELQFPLNTLDAEQLQFALEDLGALAVTLEDAGDDALLEPAPGEQPLWRDSKVRALFDADADMGAVTAALHASLGENAPLAPELVAVPDRQWETAWRAGFKPMRFGTHLWVCPTDSEPPDAAAVIVRLDPGLAFGTGTHPTTALCLEWLAAEHPAGKRVIDYGCGSGILAIAAAKLGATGVVAVDHDAQAITATRDNARANGVGQIVAATLSGESNDATGDVLIANILARPLTELAGRFANRVSPGGRIALAGVLENQGEALARQYARYFEMDEPLQRDGWILLSGTRRIMR